MKIPYSTVPLLIVGVTVIALWSTRLFAIPTITVDFDTPGQASITKTSKMVTMTVAGVKCTDTAKRAADTLADTSGILRYVAYASYNRVEITFQPERISIPEIQELLEGPVFVEETGTFLFNLFTVLEINGKDVHTSIVDKP